MTEHSEELVEAKALQGAELEATIATDSEPKPAPKRRGRKPKAKPEQEEKPAPKKRGRKPKAKPADKPEAAPAEGAQDGSETPLAAKSAEAAESVSAGDAPDLSDSEPKPAPKRRGRKPKAKPEQDTEALSTDNQEEKPAPKRRGRKPKAMTPDPELDGAADTSEVRSEPAPASFEAGSPEESEEPAKKPTRRRSSRKAVMDAESVDSASAEESAPVSGSKGAKQEPSGAESETHASEGSSEDSGSESASGDSEHEEASEEPRPRRRRQRRDDKGESSEHHGRQRERTSQHDDRNGRRRDSRDRFDARKKDKRDRNKPVQPKTSREELSTLKVPELRAKATELGIEHKGLLKAALIEAVFEASLKAEGFVEVEGILDIMPDGFGFVRTNGYFSGPGDAYVHASMVRKFGLRKGDLIKGQTRPARRGDKFPALQSIYLVNGKPLEEASKRPRFSELTPVFPDERLVMEHGRNTLTARVIDLCAPIGKGQRGLIVSPPKAGKTTVLKNIAAAISANNPEVHLTCLLVDERPEEVTDMQRSINGEVVASTFDMPCENHINCAEMVIERAKRLVEDGEDVVVLLDSLTRLARAYNLAQPASGRILSGGVDSTALYPPKKFLGAARNIEGGGSLTILASALVETGSKMDEVIFEEFKGTGNMELKLDRQLAERRIFPAIDPIASGTRREDLLLDPQEAPLIWAVRRILSNRNNTERAMDTLIKSLRATRNNQEFLLRTAKKAQGRSLEDSVEL